MNRPRIAILAILIAGITAGSVRWHSIAAFTVPQDESRTSTDLLDLQVRPAPSRSHPAIAYMDTPPQDPVAELNLRMRAGEVQLELGSGMLGFLRSILTALNVPVQSQVVVFSKTSLQSSIIGPQNPRSVFFNDAVAVAWPRRGFIEVAAVDPRLGVNFYTLDRSPDGQPVFVRQTQQCLVCHASSATLGVPGMAVGSIYPEPDGMPVPGLPPSISDHRTPFEQRWGGWYVTGIATAMRHLGNAVVVNPDKPESMVVEDNLSLPSLKGRFETDAYLSPYSDAAALMVLEHQTRLTNLLTRMGWEVRVALSEKRDLQPMLDLLVREIVDYMLFVDEALLSVRMESTSGFAEAFAALGPRDGKGRSLRDLDLTRRLMRYPCSYLIYSRAFDGLPTEAGSAIYQRLWDILSGQDSDPRYGRLSFADRQAIVEILRDTKPDLPSYFLLLPN